MKNLLAGYGRSFALSLHQSIMLFCLFSCILSMARVAVTGNPTYLFLIWNLVLAMVPYYISLYLHNNWGMAGLRKGILLAAWLLFVPNSFYLLTDLFHLPRFDEVPAWFDLLLLLSFGMTGLLLGIISIRKIEICLERVTRRAFPLVIVFAIMLLNAFGIYLGRYLRFNSWDIIARPFVLMEELVHIVFHPFENLMEWGMVGSYAIFMTLIYIVMKKLGENLFAANNKTKS